MKRYRIWAHDCDPEVSEDPKGQWVRFADIAPSPSPAGEGWQEKAERLERREVHLEVEFAKALTTLPECPPQSVLRLLRSAGKWPDDWERGKRLQNKLSLHEIPPKTEYELAAGVWTRIREAMLAASALAEAMEVIRELQRALFDKQLIIKDRADQAANAFLASHSKGE